MTSSIIEDLETLFNPSTSSETEHDDTAPGDEQPSETNAIVTIIRSCKRAHQDMGMLRDRWSSYLEAEDDGGKLLDTLKWWRTSSLHLGDNLNEHPETRSTFILEPHPDLPIHLDIGISQEFTTNLTNLADLHNRLTGYAASSPAPTAMSDTSLRELQKIVEDYKEANHHLDYLLRYKCSVCCLQLDPQKDEVGLTQTIELNTGKSIDALLRSEAGVHPDNAQQNK